MPEPRPLYCLPEVAAADRVFVTEGEKAADAIRTLGLTATTAAGGSSAAAKTDWSPMAGKEVGILPDADAAGEKYVADVVKMLSAISPRPSVKIVRLPGLPEKGDAADFTSNRDASTARQEIETMAADAEAVTLRAAASSILPYMRFPVDTLPPSAHRLVISASKSLGCDDAFITLPMLPVLASAIGCSRCLELKPGWRVLPILWSAVIGESGTAKSPAFCLVTSPLEAMQHDRLDEHATAMARHDQDVACYEKQMAAWRKDKSGTLPPDKPVPPVATRYMIEDATTEAVATILRDNPRGVLLARDELAGWVGSFDRYASGSGDEGRWLSMHNGGSVTVDRKTGQYKTIFVRRAAVSLTGGVQPGVLQRVIGPQHRESGLLARILLAQPPRHRKRWSDNGIDPQVEAAYGRLLKRLHSLTFDESTERPEPVAVGLSPAATEAWTLFFEEHAALTEEATGALASAFSKLEETAARLALVLQFSIWADGDELTLPTSISSEAMEAAIAITRWFTHETRRVYGTFGESDNAREERLILEWVQRRGGRATAREAGQNLQAIESSDVADLAMGRLVAAGLGRWEDKPPGPRGGRPSRVFVLTDAPPLTKPHETAETASFVGEEAEELVI
jgi:hypothetical protein